MTDPRELRDSERNVDLALHERLGSATPPDLTARVLGAPTSARLAAAARATESSAPTGGRFRGGRWLLAAALLILGVGIVFAIRASIEQSDTDTQETREQQDPVESDDVVRPRDRAEFLRLLPDVTAVSYRALRAVGRDLTAAKAEFRTTRYADVEMMRRKLVAKLQSTDPAGWEPSNVIGFHLKNGKRINLAVDAGRRISIHGAGDFLIDATLAQTFRDWIGMAESSACRELGIVRDPIEIAMMSGEAFSADLETLFIAKLDDDNAALLSRFTKLRRIEIDNSPQLGASGMAEIAKLKTLEEFHSRWAQFDDAAIAELAALPKLRRLELERIASPRQGAKTVRFTGEAFAAFFEHRALRHLDLSWGAGLSDDGLMAITAIPNLEELELDAYGKLPTDAPLTRLGAAKHLRSLVLDNAAADVDGAIAELAKLAELERLSLSDTNVSDAGLEHLRGHPRLRELELDRCKNLTEESFKVIATLPALRKLSAKMCPNVRWAALVHLAPCDGLEELDVSNNRFGRDGKGYNMPILFGLRRVDLSFTGATDRILDCLPLHRDLRELNLAGNDGITDAGLRKLGEAVRLEKVNLNVCDGFTTDGAAVLRFLKPDAEIVWPQRLR